MRSDTARRGIQTKGWNIWPFAQFFGIRHKYKCARITNEVTHYAVWLHPLALTRLRNKTKWMNNDNSSSMAEYVRVSGLSLAFQTETTTTNNKYHSVWWFALEWCQRYVKCSNLSRWTHSKAVFSWPRPNCYFIRSRLIALMHMNNNGHWTVMYG